MTTTNTQTAQELIDGIVADNNAWELKRRQRIMRYAEAGYVRVDLPGTTANWAGYWGDRNLAELRSRLDWAAYLMADGQGGVFIMVPSCAAEVTRWKAEDVLRFFASC